MKIFFQVRFFGPFDIFSRYFAGCTRPYFFKQVGDPTPIGVCVRACMHVVAKCEGRKKLQHIATILSGFDPLCSGDERLVAVGLRGGESGGLAEEKAGRKLLYPSSSASRTPSDNDHTQCNAI